MSTKLRKGAANTNHRRKHSEQQARRVTFTDATADKRRAKEEADT